MSKLSFHKSWENIFNKYSLLRALRKDGFVDITADAIKTVDGKEPRNMTKIDFREKLPHIMQEEGLSILAIQNGLYRIAQNDPFVDVQEEITNQIIEIDAPKNILTIDPFNIKTESAALDIAALSAINKIVFGEENQLTVRGRMRGNLNFSIGATHYPVNGVQIEVDGGYEASKSLHLIEAKIGYSNNINIRQLLYPQLFWEHQLQGKKNVKSYLFYLHGDTYRFIPYYYDNNIGYIDHAQEKSFRFKEPSSDFSLNCIKVNPNKVNTSVPFPQADRFETIHTMLILVSEKGCISKEELSLHFDIVDRQIDYYFNVLKWLQVCTEENECFILTHRGSKIVNMPFRQRMEALAEIVFSDPITNAILHNKTIQTKYFDIYNIHSHNTIKRRIQTVKAWIKYFKNL